MGSRSIHYAKQRSLGVVQAPAPSQISTQAAVMRVPYRLYRDPLPPPRSKYSFSEMQVGDCIYIPLAHVSSPTALALAASEWARRKGKDWKFATKLGDGCVGVWRVA